MKLRRAFAALLSVALTSIALEVAPAGAATSPTVKIGVDGTSRIESMPHPRQPGARKAAAIAAAGATTESQCFGDDETLVIRIASFDPANPGMQDVVFFKETAPGSGGTATLWVAWDFLTTAYGRADVITCDQLAYLQSQMDRIVDTDVHCFGAYEERPAGNPNIDVMIYNIVDESFFDPEFPFYIAGFYDSSLQAEFDRNMVFIDSYDWVNRLGAGVRRPYLYEGVVAHELEHLIMNDHDADEVSWVDEGLADLAEYLNGFGHPDDHVVYYLAFHRNGLTGWDSLLEDYGAAYLFELYLLENFGERTASGAWANGWTRKLEDEQANSIAGVENATGADFEDLYDSWILANLVDRPGREGAGSFPLGYRNIDLAPYVSPNYGPWSIERAVKDIYAADTHGNLPISRYYGGAVSGTVEFPLGADAPYSPIYKTYGGAPPALDIMLRGDAQSGLPPHEGSYEVASGGGNMLTDRMLELDVPVGGTLSFWTWWDIEEEWDYGFVEASTDGGAHWTKLVGNITRHSTNPNGSTAWANALGGATETDAAITGASGDWVQGSFELPAGSSVLVRFSYYTDEAVNGKGWFIDEVSVDGFADGFESGAADWTLGGWSRTTGLFDNDWILAFVNPINRRGKPDRLDIGYLDGTPSGGYERITGHLDTSRLGNDHVTLVFSNRPGEGPFDAGYLLLVKKA